MHIKDNAYIYIRVRRSKSATAFFWQTKKSQIPLAAITYTIASNVHSNAFLCLVSDDLNKIRKGPISDTFNGDTNAIIVATKHVKAER